MCSKDKCKVNIVIPKNTFHIIINRLHVTFIDCREGLRFKYLKRLSHSAMTSSLQIHMEGVRGHHYQGDIAIDDLFITAGSCDSQTVNGKTVFFQCFYLFVFQTS